MASSGSSTVKYSFSASLNIFYSSNLLPCLMYKLTISFSFKLSLATFNAYSHFETLAYISNASIGKLAFKKYFSPKSYYLTSA